MSFFSYKRIIGRVCIFPKRWNLYPIESAGKNHSNSLFLGEDQGEEKPFNGVYPLHWFPKVAWEGVYFPFGLESGN